MHDLEPRHADLLGRRRLRPARPRIGRRWRDARRSTISIVQRVVTVAIVLALASPAHADRDRDLAQYLSVGGTAASSLLVLGGFMFPDEGKVFNEPLLYSGLGTSLVTPSIGEYYSGQYLTWGMGIRAVAVGLALIGLQRTQPVRCDNATSDQNCDQLTGSGFAIIGLAAIAYVGGAALDCEDAPDAADHYNRVHFGLAPTVMPTPSGVAPGLYFSLTY